MFLTVPTITELLHFDLQSLVEMLVRQYEHYSKILAREGISEQSKSCQQVILELQKAIELKRAQMKKDAQSAF
jgi:hypothetical protein